MQRRIAAPLAAATILMPAAFVSAVDLTVSDVRVQHAIQSGSSRLVAGRTGWVRVKVSTGVSGSSVDGVEATMRVFVDGVELPDSPLLSINGPISAPPAPEWGVLDHTLNFPLLVPASGEVTLSIEVNPFGAVSEPRDNNVSVVSGLQFACAALVDLAFVPIDYTLGAGLPNEALIRPGIGDNFVQAIFGSGGVLYHRAPVPPVVWSTSINSSMSQLLGALQQVRLNLIPSTGFPRPEFLYGWLAGNPFWGNGAAISAPGDVGAGNTALDRFQRTFAHEIGHLVGRQHVSSLVETVGIDVEHHLLDTEQLAQLFPIGKFDIMVPGKLTVEAWVDNASWHAFIDDQRFECGVGGIAGDGSSGPIDDRPSGVLVSGLLEHEASMLSLRPMMPLWQVDATPDDPAGDLRVELLAGGETLYAVTIRTGTTRPLCTAPAADGTTPLLPDSWVSAVLPMELFEAEPAPDTVRAVRIADGAVLGERWRSPSRPHMQSLGAMVEVASALPLRLRSGGAPDAVEPEMLRVGWSAVDLDGDVLSANVLYSPDGQRWVPLAIDDRSGLVGVPVKKVPSAREGAGRIRVIVSDGFDWDIDEFPMASAVGAGTPPEVHLVSPNDGSAHRRYGPIILHAAGWDAEDGILPESSLYWTSSIDGPIAVGRILLHAGLSQGEHVLMVTGIDSDGMFSSDSVTLTVEPRPYFGADLSGDGVVDGADLGILLAAWGPCAACPADLNDDGVVDGADLGILLASWTGQ